MINLIIINKPGGYSADMMLVYKGSNQYIHSTSHRMTHQQARIKQEIKINGNHSISWGLFFQVLDDRLVLEFYSQKLYKIMRVENKDIYIEIPSSYIYLIDQLEGDNIILHGMLIYVKEYRNDAVIEERFKYQVIIKNDQMGILYQMIETSKRIQEEIQMM